MNIGKVRIYELSKELNLENKDILAICEQEDIAVKSHSSTITEKEADKIKAVATAPGYKPVSKASSSSQARSSLRPSLVKPPKPPVAKPKRPRQQQILEIRRYPKSASSSYRIYQLAKELNLDNKNILAICEELGITVKGHSSIVSKEDADRIRREQKIHPRKRQVEKNIHYPIELKEPPGRSLSQLTTYRPQLERNSNPSPPLAASRLSFYSSNSHTICRTPRTMKGYIESYLDIADDAVKLQMMLVPTGIFTMGSPNDEIGRTSHEAPQHKVKISQFFMGRYPVTQAQWKAVVNLPPVRYSLNSNPAKFKGNNNPVEQVSWYEATEFCDRLAKHTNRPYRLPSESEWEYACRSGTTTPFHFGMTLTDELANYDALAPEGEGFEGEYRKRTTSVNHFYGVANAFGLSDMHGNVYEWCQDNWHSNYKDAPIDGKPWTEDGDSSVYVVRGGSWKDIPQNCRSACRSGTTPEGCFPNVGFRVICSVEI